MKRREENETETSQLVIGSYNNPTSEELDKYITAQDEKDKKVGLTSKLSSAVEKAKRPEDFFILAFGFVLGVSGFYLGLFFASGGYERLINCLIFMLIAIGFYKYRYKPSPLAGLTKMRTGGA